MRLIDTNIRCNAVAPGATVTPAHLANKAGEQPGGAEMLKYSGHFVYFPGPECDPMDQAYACLYLCQQDGPPCERTGTAGMQRSVPVDAYKTAIKQIRCPVCLPPMAI